MLTAADVLAVNNFGDTRAGGLAGPMGLFIIVLLAIATILLIRNMNTRLRRLPDRFPEQPGDRPVRSRPPERGCRPTGDRPVLIHRRVDPATGAGSSVLTGHDRAH